jgi:hypothetical protein
VGISYTGHTKCLTAVETRHIMDLSLRKEVVQSNDIWK